MKLPIRFALLVLGVLLFVSATANAQAKMRLAGCDTSSSTIDDCNYQAYLGRFLAFTIPGIVIALLMLCCCPFWYCGRYCCGCCGSSTQSAGFFCGGSDKARYTQFDICRAKLFTVVLVLFVVGSCIYGLTMAGATETGLVDFGLKVVDTPATLNAKVQEIADQLVVDVYDASTDSTTKRDLFAGTALKNSTDKASAEIEQVLKDNLDSYRTYVDRFSFVLFIVLAAPVLFIILGLLSAVLSIHSCLPMLITFFVLMFGEVLWLGHGIFSGVGMVLGDTCAELQGVIRQQRNVLTAVIPCPADQFAEFRQNFKNIEVNEAENACLTMRSGCYDNSKTDLQNVQDNTLYSCPARIRNNCTGMTFGELLSIVDTDYKTHPNIETNSNAQAAGSICQSPSNVGQCTLPVCQVDCGDATVRRQAKQSYNRFQIAARVSETLDTIGAQYSTCDSILSVIFAPFDSACTNISNGFSGLRLATGMMGLCAISIIFAMAMGSKRFIPLDDAYKALPAEDE